MTIYDKPRSGDADRYARSLTSHSLPRVRPKPKHRVGYGSPPISTRFQTGRSGNPKGRPKGSRNLRIAIEKLFTDKIKLREGNKVRRVTRLEAVLMTNLTGALKGDQRAIRAVCATANALGLMNERQEKLVLGDLSSFTDEELDEFERLLAKSEAKLVPV